MHTTHILSEEVRSFQPLNSYAKQHTILDIHTMEPLKSQNEKNHKPSQLISEMTPQTVTTSKLVFGMVSGLDLETNVFSTSDPF